MREITHNEVSKLYDCVRELSDYHNTTSVNFKGFYVNAIIKVDQFHPFRY